MGNEMLYNSKETPLIWILIQLASIWILSDIGYYVFLPALGFGGGYTTNPVQITIYYCLWLLLTVFSFWNIYKELRTLENRIWTYLFVLLASAGVIGYLTYILPVLPQTSHIHLWKSPTELLFATPWYFLPKSIDILLQQLLVAAMVITFSLQNYSLKTISIWCAALFGGAHLLLAFGGGGLLYVSTFTLSAIIASFIFPYLILRIKNGFIYSYFLHWLFYATVIVLVRVF